MPREYINIKPAPRVREGDTTDDQIINICIKSQEGKLSRLDYKFNFCPFMLLEIWRILNFIVWLRPQWRSVLYMVVLYVADLWQSRFNTEPMFKQNAPVHLKQDSHNEYQYVSCAQDAYSFQYDLNSLINVCKWQ